jgi:hypothetical protein
MHNKTKLTLKQDCIDYLKICIKEFEQDKICFLELEDKINYLFENLKIFGNVKK